MARPRTGRDKSIWKTVLGKKPVDIFQGEQGVVKKIASLVGVDDLIKARFTGTLHVVFDRGLPLTITRKTCPKGAKVPA